MRDLPRDKASGPDGIPNEYYKTFAKRIAGEFTNVLNEAHEKGGLDQAFTESLRAELP